MQSRRPVRHLALFAALAMVACGETPTETETSAAPSFARAEARGGGGRSASTAEGSNHFVVFAAGIPDDFAGQVAAAGGRIEGVFPEVGVAVVGDLGPRAARDLKRSSGASYVELEPVLQLVEPAYVSQAMTAGVEPASPGNPAAAFYYPVQWNLHAIEAQRAWAAGRLGDASTTVAILDTGIDYVHPDLAGLVDLSRSASFVPVDDAVAADSFPNRHPITDLHYHGTHVASTVAANGYGMAGVTSGVTLVGVKVCSFLGGCPGSAVFAGVMHAVQVGADVANMSLGGAFTKRDYPGYVSVIQRLFNYANQQGVTMVVSAGNSAFDLDHDKDGFKTYCNAANVVCVSATGPSQVGAGPFSGPFADLDSFAPYSNYGRSSISVAAPGGKIAGLIGVCSSSSLVVAVCQTGAYYLAIGGTSMASPHAAGVAALISEDVGRNPAQIRTRLQQSADDLGQPGTDPFYGKGRINAGNAVGAN